MAVTEVFGCTVLNGSAFVFPPDTHTDNFEKQIDMKNASKIMICTILSLFVGTAAFAQLNEQTGGEKDPSGYGAWDANTDDQIDQNEFSTGFGNQDYYNQWDSNRDGQLDENEWNQGFSTQYRDNQYDGVYSDWDANGDGYLDNDEYSTGTYGMWDADGNGYIDNDEYTTWNRDRDGGR